MRTETITQEEIKAYYMDYAKEHKHGIDGYYALVCLKGKNYQVINNNQTIAVYSIHEERGLAGFYVIPNYRMLYNDILDFILNNNDESLFYVSDIDKTLFTRLSELGYQHEVQSYNFITNETIRSSFEMRFATMNELEEIKTIFGDFLEDYKNLIDSKQIFVYRDSQNILVSLGSIEPIIINPKRVCIGMKVNEDYRRQGYGKKTVQFLMSYLQSEGLEPNARCWVKNTISKRTLENCGFTVSNKNHIFHL